MKIVQMDSDGSSRIHVLSGRWGDMSRRGKLLRFGTVGRSRSPVRH